MYYLCDLYKGTSIAFQTQESLLYYWRERLGHDSWYRNWLTRIIDELNVTGKDVITWPEFYRTSSGFQTVWHRAIRRYQVLDDYDRSIDIRQWKAAIANVDSGHYHLFRKKRRVTYSFRSGPVPYIRKRHGHRIGCESFYRSSLRALVDDPLEDLDVRPVIDHTSVRKSRRKLKFSGWDNAEAMAAGKYNRRCWKNSCKVPHQWAKHKKGYSWDAPPECEDDVDWDALCLEALYV